jgi:hypothetical protein
MVEAAWRREGGKGRTAKTDADWRKPWAKAKSSAPVVRCGVGSSYPEAHCGHSDTERLEEYLGVSVDESEPIYRCMRPECRFTNHGFAGIRWEEMVVAYLRSIGSIFANVRQGIDSDEWPEDALVPPPDVRGIDGWVIECKNRSDHQYARLGEAIDQLIDEMEVTGDAHGAVISNRRGRPIEDAYVVMRLGDWANVIAGVRAQP